MCGSLAVQREDVCTCKICTTARHTVPWLCGSLAVLREDACTCKICTTARHTVPWCAERLEWGYGFRPKRTCSSRTLAGFHFRCVGVRLSAKGHFRQPKLAEHLAVQREDACTCTICTAARHTVPWLCGNLAVQRADVCTCKICTTARHTVPWLCGNFAVQREDACTCKI